MSESSVRHMIAILATLICLMAYYSGYVSGKFGWWWTVFGILIIYGAVYKIINTGGH